MYSRKNRSAKIKILALLSACAFCIVLLALAEKAAQKRSASVEEDSTDCELEEAVPAEEEIARWGEEEGEEAANPAEAARYAARIAAREAAIPQVQRDGAGGLDVKGPYVHRNLAIYLVLGEVVESEAPLCTLKRAMNEGFVTVHETEEVEELAIENKSADYAVFVQAGDIVQGGKQDRVITVDLLLAPSSGKLPISSFCVERGRWSRRGEESEEVFDDNPGKVMSKGLKLAAKSRRAQGEVWNEVQELQGKLRRRVNSEVCSPESMSSLPLAVENDRVKQSTEGCIEAFMDLPGREESAIGFVCAVNGVLDSAEIYGFRSLFLDLWPDLLMAAAVEAAAEQAADKGSPWPAAADAAAFLANTDRGEAKDIRVTSRSRMVERNLGKDVLFEYRNDSTGTMWLHRNYIRK